ncbi:MAG: pilus assembly protein PilP [Sandaracinaceae bacterium]
MGKHARLAICLALGALSSVTLVGCDDEPIQVGRGTGQPAQPPVTPGSDPSAALDAGTPAPTYRDEDFAEADTNRDPFRNYAATFEAQAPLGGDTVGRTVVMPDTGIDEMRLIAIVTGVADARAMLVDRAGVGHTVRRGTYLGRSEVVQAGGTEELAVTLNWRVERIRPGEVVLTREDPTAPNRPPLTRIIPLRDEADELTTEGVRTVVP